MEPTLQKKHLVQVDYIRAIAALSVAAYHLGGKALPVLKYGWLGVEMFFFLSGFIICWAIPRNYNIKKHSLAFLLKRIIRIEPPYLISIILILLLNSFTITNYHIDWLNLFFHVAYINNFLGHDYFNVVYWTLGVEFQFYIFIALLFPIVIKQNYGKYILLVLSLIPLSFKIDHTILFGVFPLFALGIYTYLYKVKTITINEFILFSIAITAISTYTLGYLETIAALFALSIILMPLKKYPIISFFSKISFSLYLIHDIIGSRLVVFLGNILPKTILFKALSFSTGILISILASWIFYFLVEKIAMNYSKSIKYKKV